MPPVPVIVLRIVVLLGDVPARDTIAGPLYQEGDIRRATPMDAAQFFLLRHEPLHAMMTDRLLADVSEAQLRVRPQGQNALAWLLWHVARGEDIGVNAFAYDRPQVYDEGDWAQRIGAGRRDLGTSMTSDEVTALSDRIDVQALRDYWRAVGDRTLGIVRRKGSRGWGDPVDPARMRRIIRESGDYGPRVDADRVETFYAGMTRGWALAHLALSHSFGHFGEATVVRGMLGFSNV
jgi:DinB superfamily